MYDTDKTCCPVSCWYRSSRVNGTNVLRILFVLHAGFLYFLHVREVDFPLLPILACNRLPMHSEYLLVSAMLSSRAFESFVSLVLLCLECASIDRSPVHHANTSALHIPRGWYLFDQEILYLLSEKFTPTAVSRWHN